MSQLSPQAIAEFQALWKKHYGAELPPEQGVAQAHQLLALVQLLASAPLAQPPPGTSNDPSPLLAAADHSL